jgi:hypothetical protein
VPQLKPTRSVPQPGIGVAKNRTQHFFVQGYAPVMGANTGTQASIEP